MKPFVRRMRDTLTRDDALEDLTRGQRRAELTGFFAAAGTVTLAGGGRISLRMRTEHAGTGRRIVRLLRAEFSLRPTLQVRRASRLGGQTSVEIRIDGDDGLRVMQALGLSPLAQGIPKASLKTRKSRDGFLRGVFLGCGTMTDPSRGYRLEFLLQQEGVARSIARFLRTFYAVRAGLHLRKQLPVVYISRADDIAQLLSAMGANAAILEMENVRITKDARNRANRAANCDSGNITKMLSAAERQLEAIGQIERTIGLEALPDTLRDVAVERMLHPDISLEALGDLLEPKVGKSGVHHRLSRIEALAKSIAEKELEKEEER